MYPHISSCNKLTSLPKRILCLSCRIIEHDNRDNEEGYHGGPSAQRGHGTNRVWRKGDKHVQFNENRHLGVSTGGPRGRGIRKKFRGTDRSLATRLGPIAEDDTTHRHPNAGRARPLP